MAMMSSAAETSSRHFFGPVSTIKNERSYPGGRTLYDIVQNSNERVAILVPRRQVYFLHHLTQEEYLPLNHLEFVTLVSHPPDGCQGRQKGVLLQPVGVWSKRSGVLL